MRQWFRRITPTEETLRAHPSLRWLGPLLRRPWLWQLSRRRVALGAGIGVFFGFLIPVAQIFGAALFALLLRANLPVAAVSTLVTNPVTFGPVFVLAYKTGSAVLGRQLEPGQAKAAARVAQAAVADAPGWIDRAASIGKPLFLGLAIFAVVGGLAAWALVHLIWTAAVWLERRRRRRRRKRPVGVA
ncbi:MAG: DUF2062 domain-containing protein [Burkholderiales bacterium]|nr:DUF2062 domain-containing protein [Burkholderiales bacterium]